MSPQKKTLVCLHEELRNLRILDRLHDYSPETDRMSERAHEIRQLRRKQILHEISTLKTSKTELKKSSWVGRAVFFACAISYAMLFLLLR
jgi:hypothetical protein